MLQRGSTPFGLRRACVAASVGFALACGGGVSTAPNSDAADRGATPEAPNADAPALGGPWLGSFEAGLDGHEQLWLLPVSGAPVSVMPINDDPPNVVLRSSYGYSDELGYVAQTLFDAANGRIIVSSRPASASSTRWLDLASGVWTAFDAPGFSLLHDTAHGAVILSTDSIPGGVTTVTAAVGAGFEAVADVQLEPGQYAGDLNVQRYRVGDAERILIAGSNSEPPLRMNHYERAASGWLPVESPIPSSKPLRWVAPSGDGIRFCAVTGDESGWLITAGTVIEFALPFPSARCGFGPDGSRAVFTESSSGGKLVVTDTTGAPLATFDRLFLQVHREPFSYGSNGKSLVRLDWRSLELETLPSPVWCPGLDVNNLDENHTGVAHMVRLLESVAVVENFCGSIDSHFSGVYLLPLAEGAAAEPLISPRAWDILQVASLADGSALIAQDPAELGQTVTEGDRFLRVSPDGLVTELGPFDGLPLPLHAPVGAADRSRKTIYGL